MTLILGIFLKARLVILYSEFINSSSVVLHVTAVMTELLQFHLVQKLPAVILKLQHQTSRQ